MMKDLNKPRRERGRLERRTLENLKQHLDDFMTKANGDVKKAKEYFNVIHAPLLDIPINQVKMIRILTISNPF